MPAGAGGAGPWASTSSALEIGLRRGNDRRPGECEGRRLGAIVTAPRFGLTDGEILDVVLAAAARAFFSKTLDALGVAPDARYAELEPAVREALTVGRAIADA